MLALLLYVKNDFLLKIILKNNIIQDKSGNLYLEAPLLTVLKTQVKKIIDK